MTAYSPRARFPSALAITSFHDESAMTAHLECKTRCRGGVDDAPPPAFMTFTDIAKCQPALMLEAMSGLSLFMMSIIIISNIDHEILFQW